MVLLPLLQVARGAEHFRWRMFGDVHQLPTFEVIDAEGRRSPVAPADYTAALRGDVDYATLLPPHLCAVVPGARAVHVQTQDSEREHGCP